MIITLLGSTGFLGRHLKARLEKDGHTVQCPGRHHLLPTFGPSEVIINAAAELDDAERMVESNVFLTRTLLERALGTDCRRVIQIGSSSETGPVEGPRSEETFCRPSNLYEATKLAATNLCLGYASQYNLDVVVARPFTLYGPGDKPRKLLPTLWRAFCEGKPVDIYPGGHDWLHVDDFVDGIVRLVHASMSVTRGQVYHFGTGISTSNASVVELFERAVGGKLNATYHPHKLRSYDVMDWRADRNDFSGLCLADARLGWRPTITLEQGIASLVMHDWFKEDKAVGL